MWHYRFTLRHTDNGKHSELSSDESRQFADEAFAAGWALFYEGGFSKTHEVLRCIVYNAHAIDG